MKIVINTHAFIPKQTNECPDGINIQQAHTVKNALTVIPRVMQDFADDADTQPIYCFKETATHIGVPRAFFESNRKRDHEVIEDYCNGAPTPELTTNWKAEGKYAEQKIAVDSMVDVLLKGSHGAILQGNCAFGKTQSGIEIARRLGRATIILCHKDFLIDQWTDRIKMLIPDARVGLVKQNTCDYRNKDFTVASIQTLLERKYDEEFYKTFGTIICDECHRSGSRTWSDTLNMFPAKYKLGLSATPRRKDGCENIFFWSIGPIGYVAKTKPIAFKVKKVDTGWTYKETIMKPQALSMMSVDQYRNRRIVDELVKALTAGRKVLVMGERLNMLEGIKIDLEKVMPGISIGIYCGEWFESTADRPEKYKRKKSTRKMRKVTKAEKELAAGCRVILATRQTVEEGFDVQDLDTLALVTPISDPEQAVGRIRRHPREGQTKKDPIVIDFVDNVGFAQSSFKWRKQFYVENDAMPASTGSQIQLIKKQS